MIILFISVMLLFILLHVPVSSHCLNLMLLFIFLHVPVSGNVNYKQVTIASMPLSPPTSNTAATKEGSPSHSVKAILTPSKSLGFIDTSKASLPEEEYIEMDPVYAPVAPDELPPEPKKDGHSEEDGKGK